MSRITINHIKLIVTLQLVLFTILGSGAQICTDDNTRNNWNNSWVSCRESASPNPERPKSHWLLYEFDELQSINLSHIWNANRRGESAMGIKKAIIDYSVDGITWTTLGTFTFPKAGEKNNYTGFEGPDFGGAFISKILITVIETHGDGACASLAEMKFNVNPAACYGEVDECGVCNGNGKRTWYRDQDGDGLGDPGNMKQSCEQPAGFVANADDNCDTGVVGWATVGQIFQSNGCTGCHFKNGASNLDLTTYATAVQGGNKCGDAILTGTTLIDIITTDSYDGCGDPFIGPSMNDRVGGQISPAELDLIKKWIEDGAPDDCNCPPDAPDSDNDGYCDAIDRCPNIDDALIGTPCDDGSDCTTDDVWQEDCECRGKLIDRDGDGICDSDDLAPDNPCTADGIVDGKEPEGWTPGPENDCDLDRISVASGDLDDFNACVDQTGILSTAECNCGDNRETAGGLVVGFIGLDKNKVKAANGQPDGTFTEVINHEEDTLTLQFPYMEPGEEICLTVAFTSAYGKLRVFLNNRLMTLKADPLLGNNQTQEFCFQTLDAGLQTLVITEDGSGNVRIDGATYSTCPCSGDDIADVACLANFEGIGWRELQNCALEVCEGQSLTLGTDRYESVVYQWRGPNGLVAESSTLRFEAVKASDSGLYWLYYRNNSGCNLIKQIDLTVVPAPPVKVRIDHPSCGYPNGEITLRFDDSPDRTNIEFSLGGPDGNYVRVADNQKNYVYSNLDRGDYDVWTRWGEGDCPVHLGTFTLRDQPAPKIEITRNQEICEGESVLLTADAAGDNLQYRWSNGRNKPRQRVFPVPAGYADQTFTYRVSVTDGNSCVAENSVKIKVYSTPKVQVDLDHPDEGAANGKITFLFADHPDREAMEISLNGENGDYQRFADNTGSYVFSGLPRGDYNTWIRWDDGSCPVDLGIISLRPNAGGCPRIRATVSREVICEGESVKLDVNRGTGWTYAWSNGATTPDQVVTPELNGFENQVFEYSVTVTDRYGCTRTDTKEVLVRSNPQVAYTTKDPHCGNADGSIAFSFKDHPDRGSLEFSIDGPNGAFKKIDDNKGELTFPRLKQGKYNAWVRWGDDSCPVDLGVIQLKDQSGPDIDLGPDRTVCEGNAIRLKVDKEKGWKYLWSNNVREPAQTLRLKTHPYKNQAKTFAVTVTDQYGCKSTDKVRVTVLSKPRAEISTVRPSCGKEDGSITLRFRNHRDRSDIAFSINGRNGKYQKISDTKGTLTFKRLKAGRYDVWARWGNSSCPVRLERIELTDRPGPKIDAGPDLLVCEGDPVRLSVNKDRNWTYKWSNKVKTPVQTLRLKADPYKNLSYNFSVTVTDQKKCSSTDQVNVKILSKPRAEVTFTRPDCGEENGTIIVNFKDHADRNNIEFSLNGQNGTFRRVRDDIGAIRYGRLAAGVYDVWARWGDKSCPVRIKRFTLTEKVNCLTLDPDVLTEEAIPDLTIGAVEAEETGAITGSVSRSGSEEQPEGILIYPNPSRVGHSITVKYYAEQTDRPLRIMSPTGQLIRQIEVSLPAPGWHELTVDLTGLAAGSYFVTDSYGNHGVFVIID